MTRFGRRAQELKDEAERRALPRAIKLAQQERRRLLEASLSSSGDGVDAASRDAALDSLVAMIEGNDENTREILCLMYHFGFSLATPVPGIDDGGYRGTTPVMEWLVRYRKPVVLRYCLENPNGLLQRTEDLPVLASHCLYVALKLVCEGDVTRPIDDDVCVMSKILFGAGGIVPSVQIDTLGRCLYARAGFPGWDGDGFATVTSVIVGCLLRNELGR